MRSVLGFDLNGLWDFIAEGNGEGELIFKDLGIHGSIVRLITDPTKIAAGGGVWVGGVQTTLAPHGRGDGWGSPIGDRENRVFWTEVLNSLASDEPTKEQADAVISFFDSFVEEPTDAHFAVPDAPSFDEAARDRFLGLLSQSRKVRATLLWRPIAALLGWLEEPVDSRSFEPRSDICIGVLSMMGDGLQYTNLRLVQETWAGSELWVPERSISGIETSEMFAGRKLAETYSNALAEATGSIDQSVLSAANSPWRMAVGEQPDFELVRLPNRSWRRLRNDLKLPVDIPQSDIGKEILESIARADALLIEGPMAGNRQWVETVLYAIGNLEHPIHRARKGIVARGCMLAARRSITGAPVYYDFLPQLEINASVGAEPRFVELIPKRHQLRGGTVYRGKAPGDFTIARGATRLNFYLFKENFSNGRKATIELPKEAGREHQIFVTVEQSPGQGFARVRVTSATFEALRHQPIELDWLTMEVVEETKEEILQSLASQTGLSYPNAVPTPGHPFLWRYDHPEGDLLQHLQDYIDRPLIHEGAIDMVAHKTLRVLRERFSTSSHLPQRVSLECDDQGSFRALDSDGHIPESCGKLTVPSDAEQQLTEALKKAGDELNLILDDSDLKNRKKLIEDIVGFSTWCFWRCSIPVVKFLLDIYSERSSIKIHHNLYREGLGRILHLSDDLITYFDMVDLRLQNDRHLVSTEFAALAKVLGTCADAATILKRQTADLILEDTCSQLKNQNDKPRKMAYKNKFKASLLMLAALLRHRRSRSDFINPVSEGSGRTLLKLLEHARRRNERFREEEEECFRDVRRTAANHKAATRRFDRNVSIVSELVAMVRGTGTDPNIIRRIDQMDDEE